eukprot:GHVL01021542.1.p1 GENE.GHVL01021542.1~~GHVL01021542.1.p1  ORF type:complete len:1467 (-),score=307.37 GHVL01021542.1:170-4027(-)
MFDSSFFNISQSEVALMDPQQRLMLELGFDALHQCGYDSISKLNKENIGVFIGCCNTDWSLMQVGNKTYQSFTSSYMTTGNSLCIISNRISYAFGLTGPSFTIDSACSSSLVALHVACTCLRDASCSRALVGGVNLILAPHIFIAFCKSRMLSPTNRCRSFDASADGYARGEGGGVIVMMRQEEVQRDSNLTVLGSVHGSYVNHVGRSASLTSPNGPAQQEVIRSALNNAGISPDEISYIESHGTGTALGDPIEIGALKAIFGNQNKKRIPLVIGALKTNIGHLEGAAGIAGLIKTLLVLQKGIAPPNLHFNKLNPHIDVTDFNAVFPSEHPVELVLPSTNAEHFFGGVSSFGFGGANAHVIVSCPIVSACSSNRVSTWMFTGQGCQYVNMGRSLYESEAAFRNAFDECDSIVVTDLSKLSLKTFIFVDNPTEENDIALDNTCRSQIAIFSFEYSLSQLWCSRGEHPSYVLGHSIGEYAAAVMAGIMTLKTALFMVSVRGDLMSSAPPGVMFACRCSETDALDVISSKLDESLRDEVSVAAVNGPKSVVLSGTEKAVSALINALNVSSKQLQVCGAFHSPLMRSCADEFARTVSNVNLQTPDESHDYPKLISCVTGKLASSEKICKVKYWSDHIIKPVRFSASIEYSLSMATSLLLEIGPSSTLTHLVKGFKHEGVTLISSMKKSQFSIEDALLLMKGSIPVVPKPPFSFNRKAVPWWSQAHPTVPRLIEGPSKSLQCSSVLQGPVLDMMLEHVILGQALMPAALYLESIAYVGRMSLGSSAKKGLLIKNIVFERPCEMNKDMVTQLNIEVSPDMEIGISTRSSDCANTASDEDFLMNASAGSIEMSPMSMKCNKSIKDYLSSYTDEVDTYSLYERLRKNGFEYGPKFRTVKEAWKNSSNDVFGYVEIQHEISESEKCFLIHPTLIDGCLQLIGACIPEEKGTIVPFRLQSMSVDYDIPICMTCVWANIKITDSSISHSYIVDIDIYSYEGDLCLCMKGFNVRQMDIDQVIIPNKLMWEVQWMNIKYDNIDDNDYLTVSWTNETDINMNNDNMIEIINDKNPSFIAYCEPYNADKDIDISINIMYNIITLTKILSNIEQGPKFWIICNENDYFYRGLIGLSRTLRLESSVNVSIAIVNNIEKSLKNLKNIKENEIIIKDEEILASRLYPSLFSPTKGPIELHLTMRGAISNMKIRPQKFPNRIEDHIVMRVFAVGLNFRDVLNVLGLYPGDPGPVGGDCSGIITYGNDIYNIGDEVFGLSPGCLKTFSTTSCQLVKKNTKKLYIC